MNRFAAHGPRQILLDAAFVVWLTYVALTGHIVPPAVASLLNNEPPSVVITEPASPANGETSDVPAIPEV